MNMGWLAHPLPAGKKRLGRWDRCVNNERCVYIVTCYPSPTWSRRISDDVAFAGFRKDFSSHSGAFVVARRKWVSRQCWFLPPTNDGMDAKSSSGFSFIPKSWGCRRRQRQCLIILIWTFSPNFRHDWLAVVNFPTVIPFLGWRSPILRKSLQSWISKWGRRQRSRVHWKLLLVSLVKSRLTWSSDFRFFLSILKPLKFWEIVELWIQMKNSCPGDAATS